MSREGPEYSFTDASITSWRDKLDKFDMGEYFGRRPCSIAKGVFATQAVKEILLDENRATVRAYFNGETIDFYIKLSDGQLETSIDKRQITSQIVTIAALMEIIVLVNSSSAKAISPKVECEKNEEDSTADPWTPEIENIEFRDENRQHVEKNVLVKFSVCGSDVLMRAFLDNSPKKPIFMQSSSSVTVISGSARKISLLRLLYYAKKAKFEFCAANRDYRLKNLHTATELMRDRFDVWEKYFFVQLAPEMLLLKRGIIFPEICARVLELDPGHIQIEWVITTPHGQINPFKMADLLRANGRSIFIENIGAVALTSNQISVIRHVFAGDCNAKLHKYMLYVLLNQSCITVDTTGCKITHIDVGMPEFPLPEFLKNYQRDGVYSMRAILDAGCHCLLADEMGLGKTLQALTLICSNEQPTRTLVVCPASVIFVWQREIEKFFPDRTFATVDKFYDFSRSPHFLLCSYAQVHKMNQELKKLSFDYVILDEAQYAKNPRSKTMLACCSVDGRHRIAITGTPIENNLMDIWSIFKFLMPGFFCGYRQFQENIGFQDFRDNFKKQISTFTIRRTKQSVAIELPKRNELELLCRMNCSQGLAYNAIRNGLKLKLLDLATPGKGTHMNVLTAIMRLRQAACAQFVLPAPLRHDNSRDSQKIDILLIKLENIAAEGKKAIVFSQFLSFLEEIKNRVAANIPMAKVYSLTGATVNRKTLVEDFQSAKGSAVMLISLKAGGVGITLHAAEYVFLMEPWWNPAVEEQAIARIHRIGQKNITTVYRLISKESIEERMREIQVSKNELFNEFIKTGVDNIAMTNFYLKNLESLLE
ncbi:MAG: DEAD/DEAH box helicase [Puniceicoccales bacterium]|jgi:superfamily II DNA or RNA helicase|nr:DEAD/DEAH box helicase [Puniceicoccales bacterium]